MINRTIICDVCGKQQTEKTPGEGWRGWGHVNGVILDGVETPSLCPTHLAKVMEYIEELKEEVVL